MEPYAPFAGILVLPDKVFPTGTSEVTLGEGPLIALIRWHAFTTRARFEILDARGQTQLAHGRAEGFLRRNYVLYAPSGQTLLSVRVGLFGPSGRSRVTLPDGSVLTAKGSWLFRRFEVTLADGSPVARAAATTGWWSMRPDSYALELVRPVLSPVQAIGLAQSMRAAERAQRAQNQRA
jgi:hypothetical protein